MGTSYEMTENADAGTQAQARQWNYEVSSHVSLLWAADKPALAAAARQHPKRVETARTTPGLLTFDGCTS